MTIQQRTELDMILDRHSGNLELVARVLQTTPQAVKAMIAEDPVLAGKWIGAEVNPLDRPPLNVSQEVIDDFNPVTLPPKDAALVAAVESQDRKLKQLDWGSLGITDPEQQGMFKQFEKFVGANIVSSLDATHGGMLFAFAKAAVLFKKQSEAIEALVSKDAEHGAIALASEAGQAVYEQWNATANLLVKLNADATKAGHLRVMMETKAREVMEKKGKQPNRPGFSKAKPVKGAGEKVVTVAFDGKTA